MGRRKTGSKTTWRVPHLSLGDRWGSFYYKLNVMREKWCAQGDNFRTFLSDFVANLPHFEVPAELGL
jgi:hypothetical protein